MPLVRLVVAVAAALSLCGASASASERPADDTLIQALQQGGLVIAFGHASPKVAASDGCQGTSLSPRARARAEQVGAAFRRLQIPVGLVVTNRQCRTREAATVAFGFAVSTGDLDRPRAAERLPAHIAGPVPSGENRILMTQTDLLRSVAGLTENELRAGDAVVFEPRNDGSFRVITRLSPDEWTALAGGAKLQRRADAA